MNEIEQIKERLNIEEVVGSYLTLKRAGANLKGLCPFHNEKTPSFMVNPERQIFKCFGCGEGGDIFTFIEKVEGVDFYNALKILADRSGIKLEQKSVKRGDQEYKSDAKTALFEINELAAKLYHKILLEHPKADKARIYLESRGMEENTIKEFKIGYAPDSWDFMIRFMESKGYSKAELFKAGLLTQNNKGEYYDRFRGRIMFPISNVMGNCIAFTSRILLDDGKQAKYINSAESPIYTKGRVLYGLDKAKMAIREKELAVVVEGNMDVIACHQAGFKNVVAASGTAITEEQIRSLSRYTSDIAFAFDSDSAGLTAMNRAVIIALKIDITPKIIEIPSGFKDPDEALKKDIKIWQRAVLAARPALEAWIDRIIRDKNINDISDRKKISKEILPIIKLIKTEIEREYYLKYLSKKLSVSILSLAKDLDSSKSEKEHKESAPDKKNSSLNIFQRILAVVWSSRDLIPFLGQNKIDSFPDGGTEVGIWEKFSQADFLDSGLNAQERSQLDQWSYELMHDFEEATPDDFKKELLFLLARVKQEKNENIKKEYSEMIKKAEEDGDIEKMKELILKFSQLIKE
ncbi:MAG: DNA primase [bacterium ADurb.Bin212]|nr:MAG: DNA primase [bacterium ADurb.Bin212]